jgi:hypothetical protein
MDVDVLVTDRTPITPTSLVDVVELTVPPHAPDPETV